MGKIIIGIYCYFIANILMKVFLEMFVEWPSTKHILFSPNLSILLVVMATKRLNLQKINKTIKTINTSEAIKLKLFRNVHCISFYKSIVFHCC